MEDANVSVASQAQEYYNSVPHEYVQDGCFRNMDTSSDMEHILSVAQHSATDSFVVDFSDRAAFCAFDLPANAITSLLDTDRPDVLSTRWINLYHPYQHRIILENIATRYDFSPRLFALMASDPKQPRHDQSRTTLDKPVRRRTWGVSSPARSPASFDSERDLQDELSEHSSIFSKDSTARGNLYAIVDDIYHYSSVDLGRAYVCVGYNSLYGTKTPGEEGIHGLLPNCTRVWTWLIICSDNTVISINEDPFPFAGGNLTALQQRILFETKRNLVNVLRSLSMNNDLPLLANNPLTLLPIRIRLGHTACETAHRSSDSPGLLFYYLFENWHNSYTLVTRKESRYGVELNELRKEMYECPRLHHIDRLDSIGRELGVLRRHYESYTSIVDRLLEPQSASPASLQNSQVVSSDSRVSLDTIRPVVLEKPSMLGIGLSSAARARFRRLRHLLDLYALSEVEEFIKQKDSLVTMVCRPRLLFEDWLADESHIRTSLSYRFVNPNR